MIAATTDPTPVVPVGLLDDCTIQRLGGRAEGLGVGLLMGTLLGIGGTVAALVYFGGGKRR